ncbi:hypothetical protein KKG45_11615 [bacterium]|nr:hypothetical protein [bacterium]
MWRRHSVRSLLITVFYAVCWAVQTWPQALTFRSHSWFDQGDGLVMAWNLWLARQQPFDIAHTDMLFHPEGVSLLLHTYVPLKGWLGALLPLDLITTQNLLIVLSFAVSGTTCYWLARRCTGADAPGLFAGYAFAFTGFRWAHATGHMNLISTELLPLYALLWLRFEEAPSWRRGLAAALALFAVALTDYYFAMYCGLLTAVFLAARKVPWRALPRFLVPAAATTGVLAAAVLLAMRGQELQGAHDPALYPLDPLSLIVPGGHWRFASLTEPIWSRIAGEVNEHSVNIGLGLIALAAWRGRCRRWWAVFTVFLVLGFGERLTVLGRALPVPMPYELLERVCPPLALGGVPVRMSIVVALAASVLGAFAAKKLGRRSLPLVLLLVVELWPAPGPVTRTEIPGWVEALARRPGGGAVYDAISGPKQAMFYQTVHGRPISGGALARMPKAALAVNVAQFDAYLAGDIAPFLEADYEYVLTNMFTIHGAQLTWTDGGMKLYRLVAGVP